jgi:Holliday junction resolvase RusA-like endonuclease
MGTAPPMENWGKKGYFDVQIDLPNVRGDADNYAKPILDYLVSRKITDDDRFCRKVSVEKGLHTSSICEITIIN